MSRLFLVRHAQASFLEPNYDQLSPTGESQARLLGQYWARQRLVFDRVSTGPRVRQTGTAKIVGQACRDAGVVFPEFLVMDEFDEYQGERVLEQSLPGLLESDGRVRELHRTFQGSSSSAERHANFQRMFEAVIGKWVRGEIPLDDVESWPEFCARVNRGLEWVLFAGRRGQQVAVFCSAGPVSVAVERALKLSPEDTLRLAWMVRNCSYSEFLYSGERFTLSTFNSFPHLDDPSLLTYR
jgi:broad specificity phosphatase PhoE